ncbi:MAG TPA: hypothetical protein VGF44_15115 [Terriglobales bacterium]
MAAISGQKETRDFLWELVLGEFVLEGVTGFPNFDVFLRGDPCAQLISVKHATGTSPQIGEYGKILSLREKL